VNPEPQWVRWIQKVLVMLDHLQHPNKQLACTETKALETGDQSEKLLIIILLFSGVNIEHMQSKPF
jgi:hypothetical protein